ncbi:hypothetical protein [Oscillatoria sp. FACHB-1406]|uniref:hypothetical protein n=1 Tax=Oscillatoria sp. FACHB-1406 TaxID=2692846 RepID=UPI0018EF5B5E|nr:hypothetical protein [Oscillatoria sp. FACHB-1406]
MEKLASMWGEQAHTKLSLGDTTIRILGEHYARKGYQVEFLTGDAQLKAYQPETKSMKNRRSDS